MTDAPQLKEAMFYLHQWLFYRGLNEDSGSPTITISLPSCEYAREAEIYFRQETKPEDWSFRMDRPQLYGFNIRFDCPSWDRMDR